MRFDDPVFLLQFLPSLLAVYFLFLAGLALRAELSVSAPDVARLVLILASVLFLSLGEAAGLLISVATFTFIVTPFIERLHARDSASVRARVLLGLVVAANVGALVQARLQIAGRGFAFAGATVITCHGIAYAIDVYRGRATTRHPLTSALYLVQFPVLPAGPVVRYQDFRHHIRLDRAVGLGAFTYGVRRLVIGFVKVALVARVLSEPVDAIFRLPTARLTIDAAWFAAICFALQLYFQFSGYTDTAIGLGRMFGLRYPENFHRPYLADSVREFWRRWNVHAITWLRDYLSLPIAGRDAPTPRLLANIVVAFCLLGLWHGAQSTMLVWALYSGTWLSLEAIGLGAWIERWPRVFRHLYLLVVVTIGWVILRADSVAGASAFLQVMVGLKGIGALTVTRYLSWEVAVALFVALVGAGPLVPWISRWRVSVDATAAATVMMLTAVSLYVWKGGVQLFSGSLWRRRTAPRR